MPNVYEQVKQALQDVVAPEIKELRVEIRRMDEKIDSLDKRLSEKIDSLDQRLNEKIDSLDQRLNEKIDSLDQRLNEKIDFALEFRERLVTLETRVSSLSR